MSGARESGAFAFHSSQPTNVDITQPTPVTLIRIVITKCPHYRALRCKFPRGARLARYPFFPKSLRFLAQSSLFTWRARPTPNASAGTSLVMTDPAARYAPSPTSTGATSVELLPMNAPAPILVLCLLDPS